MGAYINPPKETKESFLETHGRKIKSPTEVNEDELPVCLIDNAAGIAYDAKELADMTLPEDFRPKTWYGVQKDALVPYMPKERR